MSSFNRRREAVRPSQPGRPRKPEAKKRSMVIGVRVSEEEKLILERTADGQDLSTFLRESGLGKERPGLLPRANREIAGHLARIGNNLNQLVRLAHTGRVQAYLEPLLKRLLEQIAKYRRELLGEAG